MAMIDFWGKLKENGLKSRMIMQVHDEIVVELDKSETNTVKTLIKDAMELDQPLSVPLVVDISTGTSWKE
jgi:DNA polymerase-1